MKFITDPLNSSHYRKEFTCGKIILDNYLKTQVSQDIKRKLSACFVLLSDNQVVIGYYTLSNASIQRQILPTEIIKKLPPSYANLPATLLGRLAVDKNYFGKKLGELLLIDALKRSYLVSIESIASMAIIVDPIDDDAANFYKKYGFIELTDSKKMFLPMQTIASLFKDLPL